ncbi:MAG: DNA-3-methyladenine glycosylase 2 family protein [Eubacteriales bacterium]|nr:DNA-3-methyladenine glycosylase 2 family protein [Eubacteriales bacterium]
MLLHYGKVETARLAAADPVLGAAIGRIGPIERQAMPDLFEALINSIAGQQISGRALETVWARLCGKTGPVTPESLLALGGDELRACGLSGRKAGYMLAAAQAVQSGALDIHSFVDKPDEQVVRELTALPGVGRWTAEMLLIFSLRRPDVLSCGDFGIRKGLRMLYGLPEIEKARFETFRKKYSPDGTAASLYLWAIAGGALPELSDPAGR